MKLYSSATNSRGKEQGTDGGAKSQSVHIRTWELGIRVVSEVLESGKVQFKIYKTGGSNGSASTDKLIKIIEEV